MWIVGLYLINTVFMLIVAVCEVRRPAKALNWLAICLIFPIIGFVLYLITSNPKSIPRKKLTTPNNESDHLPDTFGRSSLVIAQSLRHLTVHGLRNGRVQILVNGLETYKQLIESIQAAQRSIDLEYYIYRDDQIGSRITDLLIERAAAGVQVRFVRDGWGSRKFPRRQIIRMMDAGIDCRQVFPVRFPWLLSNWNYRDHCKIVAIDGKEAFTGGINVGYEYTGLKPNVGFWRDTHLRIEGEAALDLQAVFDAHWNIASPERMQTRTTKNIKAENTRTEKIAPVGRFAFPGWLAEMGTMDGTSAESAQTKELQNAYVQTLEGNPGIPTPIIREAYFICLTQATNSVDITTPYFIPDADIIMAMKTAAARGVRVRLLVPRRVDLSTLLAGSASRTYYGELIEAGVNIYQYHKGMLHAKVMVIDGEIAVVGSANYDLRSHRLNYEVCEMLYNTDLAQELTKQFEHDLTNSVPLRMEQLLLRTRSERLLEQAARLFSPLL